jgi:hypothetical protein
VLPLLAAFFVVFATADFLVEVPGVAAVSFFVVG